MVRPSSRAWEWVVVTNPRTNDKPHPDVRCVFCPKTINNASVSRNLLPHLMSCKNAPRTVAIEARQLLEAAAARRPCLAVSPARRVHARRYSTTPTRQRRASLQDASIASPQAPTDRFDRADANAVRMQIARTVYAANLPFRVVENPAMNALLTALAPPGGVLGRNALATTYLDQVYASVHEEVKQLIREPEYLVLVIDGWSNIRNEGIANGVVCAPGMRPVLWKSVASGNSQHTGDYYANIAKQMITEIEAVAGKGKVIGVIGDNASTMLAAWRTLQADPDFPHMMSVGCAAHAMNLLIKAIFENIPEFGERLDQCTAISKFVKNRQALLSRLGDAQFGQESRRALSLPVATRWHSHEKCMRSVVGNRDALENVFEDQQLMARYRNQANFSDVSDSIDDPHFWFHSEIIIQVLKPISDELGRLERDDTSVSMVNDCFSRLAEHDMYARPSAVIDAELQQAILDEIRARWSTTRSDVADVAYLLDPRLPIAAFAQEELPDLVEKAVSLARRMERLDDRRVIALRNAIVRFVEQKQNWTLERRERHGLYSPSQWWGLRTNLGDLARFAKKILSIPASSASCECSFSVQSFIHSKTRSRLLTARVAKLAYIYSNISHERDPSLFEENIQLVIDSDIGGASEGHTL